MKSYDYLKVEMETIQQKTNVANKSERAEKPKELKGLSYGLDT
jgi:hypothetical protein